MDYVNIDLSVRSGVATLMLNRPHVHNAIDLATAKEMCDVASRLTPDRSVRAIVIAGQGSKAFSAGGDVASFAKDPDTAGLLMRDITGYLHLAISRLAWGNAPVIAAINGVAAGAGLSLVGACDLAIAAEHATFTSAYAKVGLTPDGSSTYFLPRILGIRRTAELYMGGRVLSAAEALDWGLINRVVPAADLQASAQAWAQELAKGPTQAFGGMKRLLMHAFSDTLESQMERETREIAEAANSADGKEGVRAFVEKRPANFTGH
ncbi:enoyl-CoA hydratase [Variovorax sp. WS11]|uniref:enoyl-CoA hydratase/isomerase family protein n=1 Tax=Variovorax sp. WS11 TaxID=1105204 RepID=UPI000D0D2C9F|nr:enoyl-CoA hydratase-related protein [Variovorax sp. WS11]NDZ17767.1 enoyl-CoA hydratase [Variovorax sp. WS11]PSL80191.1 enoyl-CoA hydratase [Variovorax sp. WS11]